MFNEKHVREFTELKAEMFNKTFKSRVGAKFEVLGAFTQEKVLAFVSISWENNVANQ